MKDYKLSITLLKENFGICRLNTDDAIPEWINSSSFYSLTKTADEISIVCSIAAIPVDTRCEKDWRALKIEGPLDFSLIGILSSISTVLAKGNISIFVVSTFDTDYILVKSEAIEKAVLALSDEGYIIN